MVDVIPIVVFIAGSATGYFVMKRKLKAIRNLVVELDNALEDDNITEEEAVRIWQRIRELVGA